MFWNQQTGCQDKSAEPGRAAASASGGGEKLNVFFFFAFLKYFRFALFAFWFEAEFLKRLRTGSWWCASLPFPSLPFPHTPNPSYPLKTFSYLSFISFISLKIYRYIYYIIFIYNGGRVIYYPTL